MKDLKDVERCLRLCEKEVDTLADQFAQRETALRLEVDRLRLGLEAVRRYLAERDNHFPEAYRSLQRRIMQQEDGDTAA